MGKKKAAKGSGTAWNSTKKSQKAKAQAKQKQKGAPPVAPPKCVPSQFTQDGAALRDRSSDAGQGSRSREGSGSPARRHGRATLATFDDGVPTYDLYRRSQLYLQSISSANDDEWLPDTFGYERETPFPLPDEGSDKEHSEGEEEEEYHLYGRNHRSDTFDSQVHYRRSSSLTQSLSPSSYTEDSPNLHYDSPLQLAPREDGSGIFWRENDHPPSYAPGTLKARSQGGPSLAPTIDRQQLEELYAQHPPRAGSVGSSPFFGLSVATSTAGDVYEDRVDPDVGRTPSEEDRYYLAPSTVRSHSGSLGAIEEPKPTSARAQILEEIFGPEDPLRQPLHEEEEPRGRSRRPRVLWRSRLDGEKLDLLETIQERWSGERRLPALRGTREEDGKRWSREMDDTGF